ncbi:50S ribosomal protein L25 [Buchnera aphidicola]|uniref:50S ribosomal protein L25 n=1 Tax=Buchnera aphidicola (Stegophylla sp.) TaxID=2315800 RepID=A0A4D6YIR5_9GAMM|nr:50S ribosomal protein L25 [Buchnera aphidicola (Stegophylla sp.)]QCI26281.1 50S ribosomal protein L25 [Buchnera aphidicola (Stegophylla sp.)]
MFLIHGNIRINQGTCYSRRLRRLHNKIPCVMYGNQQPVIYIELDHDLVFNMQRDSKFYNSIIILVVNKLKYTVIVKEVQRHCFKLKLLHIDFYIKSVMI